jgi:flagellar basal body-associated protein FliL
MKILVMIENAINFVLIKLGELIIKAIPQPIKNLWIKIEVYCQWLLSNFKKLPSLTFKFLKACFLKTKTKLLTFNYKAALTENYSKAKNQAAVKAPQGFNKIKAAFLIPFSIVSQWLNGLSAGQSMLLLTFSSASFLAVIGIGFSGQKIISTQEASRAPASVEEITYDRPKYYKKEERHLAVTNLRLPVYLPKVNGIKSVDIDFNATLSNRHSRMFLEKHEFQLRDHLILEVEPSLATFPTQEEGKEILRQKLQFEINSFLKENKIEGEVVEVKVTYILAN